MVDRKKFKYKASIDWVEIEITTVTSTNFKKIKSITDACYVNAIDSGPGGSANVFRLKLYDIEDWKQVENLIININEQKELINEPRIVAIEVSFDAISIEASRDELIEHTGEMVRMLSNPLTSIKNKRAAGHNRGTAEMIRLRNGKYWQVQNKTFYIGSQKDDDVSMRIYWKHTDCGDELTPKEQMSRIEVTLQNNGCPFTSINEAKNYQFAKLAKWFKFRKPKDEVKGFNKTILDWSSQVGVKKCYIVRKGKTISYRLNNPLTVADRELNTIAYEKLRQLTKRLNITRLTRKNRSIHF